MKQKNKNQSQAESKPEGPPSPEGQTLTVMAIQEILGLFRPKTEPEEGQERHDYLKKKPLGLI